MNQFSITLKSGTSLSIDSSLLQWDSTQTRYELKIAEGGPEFFILRDADSVEAPFPQHLVLANDLEILDNKIILSDSFYNAYFDNVKRRALIEATEMLRQSFKALYDNREVVLRDAEFFLIRCKLTASGGAYVGSASCTLGSLLEAWQTGKLLQFENDEGVHLITSIAGSPLTGTSSLVAWLQEKDTWVLRRGSEFGKWFRSSDQMAKQYPHCLRSDANAIHRLLREIK